MKIAIVRYIDCDENIERLFSIRRLIALGYEIDYLNVSSITTFEKCISYKIDGVNYVNILSYNELRWYIKKQNLAHTIFIPYMSYFSRTWKCFYILSQYDCFLVYCITGFLPEVSTFNRSVSSVFQKITLKKIKQICCNRFARYLKNTPLIKPADVIFYSGKEASMNEYKCSDKTKKYPFNSVDYQRYYLESGDDTKIIDDKYFVFIDQYLPFHQDAKIIGVKNLNADVYYKNLNTFFEIIEKKYEVKVVIAAHPRAEKYRENNYFNGREVYFNQTNQLIKYADAVILHYSTAMSMAVLNYKSCLFVSASLFKDNLSYIHNTIKSFAKILGATYYDLDEIKYIQIFPVDVEKYDKYKYGYLLNRETEDEDNGIHIDAVIKQVFK